MNDDGTMARLPDLVAFARKHGLKIGKIADLIAYRLRHDRLVERELAAPFHSRWGGDFRLEVFTNVLDGVEHVALVKGDVTTPEPVLVRVHAVNILEDILGAGRAAAATSCIGRWSSWAKSGAAWSWCCANPRPKACPSSS